MPEQDMQISKDGLKISYHRYLTDSASGFVVILGVMFAVSKRYPLPFLGHSLESLLKVTGNAQLFIFFLLFLLATPIGIFIHQLSWFLFGSCEIYSIKLWLNLPKKGYHFEKWYNPIFLTKSLFCHEQLPNMIKALNMTEGEDLCKEYRMYKEYLIMFFPEHAMGHITGLMFFIRSLGCLSFLTFLSVLHVMFWDASVSFSVRVPFVLCLVTAFFSLLYSLVESFRCLKTLATVYLLCAAKGITNKDAATPQGLIRKIHAAYFGDQSGTAS